MKQEQLGSRNVKAQCLNERAFPKHADDALSALQHLIPLQLVDAVHPSRKQRFQSALEQLKSLQLLMLLALVLLLSLVLLSLRSSSIW